MSDEKGSDTPVVVVKDNVPKYVFEVIQKARLYDPKQHTFGSAIEFLRRHDNFYLDNQEARRAYFRMRTGRVASQNYELVVDTTTGGEEFGGLDASQSGAAFKVTFFSKYRVQSADPHQAAEQFSDHKDNLEILLNRAATFGLSLEALDGHLQEAGLPRVNMDKTRAAYDLPRMILQKQGRRREPFPAALKMTVKQSHGIVEVSATYHPDFRTAERFNIKDSDKTKEVNLNLLAAMHRRQPGT